VPLTAPREAKVREKRQSMSSVELVTVSDLFWLAAIPILHPLTTLHSFCSQGGTNCTDGSTPYSGLIEGSDGNFYGATYQGGANIYYGSVYKIIPGGALSTVYSFCSVGGFSCTDGSYPYAGLVQGSGVAALSEPTGGVAPATYSITATYSGDSSDVTSTSTAIPVMVQ
jgi:uncharacterized repeat protein (TIGR03803 family)